MLSSGEESTVFTGDDDPELVGDALPFALKLYEILLEADKGNAALALSTGRAFVTYSSAFVLTPSDQLPPTELDRQIAMRQRAKKLFARGRGYVFQGLERRRPGFTAAFAEKEGEAALALVKKDDIDYVYWAGVSVLAEFSADSFDFSLIVLVPNAVALLNRVESWNPSYGDGSLDEIMISFYGSAPAEMGGSETKAREYFRKAVELTKGEQAGPYVALASTVSVKNQNATEFRRLLSLALQIDPNKDIPDRLENIINQRKAKWMLDHIDVFFLDTGEGQ
jgi:predicted anti-sigma-YlaC factor YlaD